MCLSVMIFGSSAISSQHILYLPPDIAIQVPDSGHIASTDLDAYTEIRYRSKHSISYFGQFPSAPSQSNDWYTLCLCCVDDHKIAVLVGVVAIYRCPTPPFLPYLFGRTFSLKRLCFVVLLLFFMCLCYVRTYLSDGLNGRSLFRLLLLLPISIGRCCSASLRILCIREDFINKALAMRLTIIKAATDAVDDGRRLSGWSSSTASTQ